MWVWPPFGLVARVSQAPTGSGEVGSVGASEIHSESVAGFLCSVPCDWSGPAPLLEALGAHRGPRSVAVCWLWIWALPSYLSVHWFGTRSPGAEGVLSLVPLGTAWPVVGIS